MTPTPTETGWVETPRLLLCRPTLADAPAVFAILGNPDATRHTRRLPDLRACRRHVAVHERHRRRAGCAPWLVLHKGSRRVIGYGGLFSDPFDPGWGIEVGYWLHPGAWGAGFATELVRAGLEVADRDLRLPLVRAFAKPANTTSRRVLEKTGFRAVRYVAGMERLLYQRPHGGG